jgi:hypothetical protein
LQWCKCGDIRSITDALGRTTSWRHDLQGRVQSKEYPDGSTITYRYEEPTPPIVIEGDQNNLLVGSTSRLRQRIDEQLQVAPYAYNLDDTLAQIAYTNTAAPAPPNPLSAVATRPVLYTYLLQPSHVRSE